VYTNYLLGAGGKAAGTAANTRVGWSVGQNKFVQFMGERGVEALAGLTVGAVSSEYEEDNATGTLKKAFLKRLTLFLIVWLLWIVILLT